MRQFAPATTFLVFSCTLSLLSAEPFEFVLRGDDVAHTATSFAHLNETEAGANGFVRIEDGQFHHDQGRVRFWGVNLCFGANFPNHQDAEILAKRLAKLGVNAVRFHHHETQYAPTGLYNRDGTWNESQVDKLNYLLAELHKNGIYANLNLHCGREVGKELGLPSLVEGSHSASGDKHLIHFVPEIQEGFWQFCCDYLGQKNPYRDNLRRADDPGIAMLEMLNENRFSLEGPKYLRQAQEPYRSLIMGRWNQWLKKQFGDDAGILNKWKDTSHGVGEPIASSAEMLSASNEVGGGWIIGDNGGKDPMTIKFGEGKSLRLIPEKAADAGWKNQLVRSGVPIKKGQVYTLTLRARSIGGSRNATINIASLEGGWHSLGLATTVKLTPEWQTISMRFHGVADETGTLAFDLGMSPHGVELKDIQLSPGASWWVLPPGQTLAEENIQIPDDRWVPDANDAFMRFMRDIEREFYKKTRRLLVEELKVKVPIAATQMNYMGAKLVSELSDFCDMHSYWHHPLFEPGQDWNPNHWYIGHDPISAGPFMNKWPRNSPLMRSGYRVKGMPFTYSEWNVGEPSAGSLEAIPTAALIGSIQDWDAVFFFAYESANHRWAADSFSDYFSINGQPVKLAQLGAFGNLYRNFHLAAAGDPIWTSEGDHFESGLKGFSNHIGIDPMIPKKYGKEEPDGYKLAKAHPEALETADSAAIWNHRDGIIQVATSQTIGLWGAISGQSFKLGKNIDHQWQLTIGEGETSESLGVLIFTSRDGKAIAESESILISNTSRAENTDMGWDEARKTVGRKWGKGPTVVWRLPVTIDEFPSSLQGKKLTPLDANGNRLEGQSLALASGCQLTGSTLFWEIH